MFMRAGKWEGVVPPPSNFFSVEFYDRKSMSFKLGDDIFINFEMQRVVAYIAKTSLLFRPFDSEVLGYNQKSK